MDINSHTYIHMIYGYIRTSSLQQMSKYGGCVTSRDFHLCALNVLYDIHNSVICSKTHNWQVSCVMCAGWQEAGGCQEAGGQEAGGQEDGHSGPECRQFSCAAQSPGDREAEAVCTDEYIAIGTKIKTNQGKYSSVCTQHLRLIYWWVSHK